MNDQSVNVYARMADAKERDPYGPDGSGRAIVVNGRGFQKWRRFHTGEATVWVTNPDGQNYELTTTQHRVYRACLTLSDEHPTLAVFADSLGVSRSTVWRALVKLVAFGLIIYRTARGRYARMIIFPRVKGDGLHRMRKQAIAKVREWSQAAQRRISRLEFNVAPYILEGESIRSDSLGQYLELVTSKSATLKMEWTPQELREAGII
jgi:predicted transcriptional regulator